MFGARPPLNAREQAWTEWRVHWIVKHCGMQRMRDVEMLTPDCQDLSAVFTPEAVDWDALRDLMCDRLQLGASSVHIEWDEDAVCESSLADCRTDDDRSTVVVGRLACQTPLLLVSSVSRAFADLVLARVDWPADQVTDRRFLAELMASQLGFGLFCANADGVHGQHQASDYWWSARKDGLLAARIHGYALALLMWLRGDTENAWGQMLGLDVRDAFKRSLRYLRRQRGSPDDMVAVYERSAYLAVDELSARSPSRRVHALWALRHADSSQVDIERLLSPLEDRDPTIRGEAALTLASVAGDDRRSLESLMHFLGRPDLTREERVCGVAAVGQCSVSPADVVSTLIAQLEHSRIDVAVTAALALGRIGMTAVSAIPDLLKLLSRAVIQCQHDAVDLILHALSKLDANIQDLFHSGIADTEVREVVLQARSGLGSDSASFRLPRLCHPLPLI